MAPWAELPPELLGRISDRLDLKCYASARGACRSWRRELAPSSPALLTVGGEEWGRPCTLSIASVPARRWFNLAAFVSYSRRCVGSSYGWIALSVAPYLEGRAVIVLLNPVTATEVVLPPLIYDGVWVVSKVVSAPSPAKDDLAAAAICGSDRIAYVTAGTGGWAVLGPISLAGGDHLTDLVYHGDGKVYCLTRCGDVHVLSLPERRQREADSRGVDSELSVLRCPERVPMSLSRDQPPAGSWRNFFMEEVSGLFRRWSSESRGQDMNEPVTVEPVLSEGNLPYNPATAFAPLYDAVSVVTSAMNLVFCEGNLYQVWRNTSCNVTLQLPGGGQRRVSENEIFVLRYYPQRQPCWDVVMDLGGYSIFIGRNNAVSMYAEGVPGLQGNCVYWIGGCGRDQGMVFDMETRRSTPCGTPPVVTVPRHTYSTICWYFLSNMVASSSSSSSNRGRRLNTLSIQQQKKN